MNTVKDLKTYLREKQQIVEQALEHYLPPEASYPAIIHEAMRYSVFAGGKRLRPILLLMAAEMCAKPITDVLFAAAAIEMIHTYSLIHDDLPAMDNDDLRRGKPTSHKKYGEDVAILAGDALLTLAFQVMADPTQRSGCSAQAILSAIHELAFAAGTYGMVGGQVMDMQAEKRQIQPEELEYIHSHKTGKVLTAAVRIGAILADATSAQLEAVSTYGEKTGLAFQIIDDLLDIESSTETLGKPVHSDESRQKATYPALYGRERSRMIAQQLIDEAKRALHSFGDRAYYLILLANYIYTRTH
ncbi:polyprenyl synthetase [Candidatus Vecturithrix granuli]|uniref:Polyprenyl synthetase n=1 Tax=Vecturithrix granuli TaxID=1499967 RepID=A0A081C784_VECG1|nr:polyprenyl synthetase [Candidatus Vecturithrix granuli]